MVGRCIEGREKEEGGVYWDWRIGGGSDGDVYYV